MTRLTKLSLLIASLAGTLVFPAQAQLTLSCAIPSTLTLGVQYSYACLASGGTAPYTLSISTGSLPPGLLPYTFATELLIFGTPTATGTSSFTVQVTDNVGATASQSLTITVISGSGGSVTLTSVSPNTLTAGVTATLTLTGTGFTASSIVYFNATPINPSQNSSTTLQVSVPASLVVAGTLPIFVSTAGVTSNSLSVTVTGGGGGGGSPTLTQISPTSVPVGSAGFTLNLYGSGFTQGSLVTFGSYTLSSTFISSSQLSVVIPLQYLTASQTVNVSVAGSNVLPFVIGGGLTVSCTPPFGPTTTNTFFSQTCSVAAGTTPYTWTTTGLPTGLSQSTSGNNAIISGTLTTSQSYVYTVQVADSAQHTGAMIISGTASAAAYDITSLTPSSVPVGSAAVTLTVLGAGLTPASLVYFNGTPITTMYVSSNQLNAIIPATYLTAAQSATVSVNTSGVLTNSLTFTVGTGNGGSPITVSCTPGVGPSVVNTFYVTNCSATGGNQNYTWTVPPNLPAYLTYNTTTGPTVTISGTPNVAATYNYNVTVTDTSTPVQTGTLQFAGQTSNNSGSTIVLSTLSPGSAALNAAPVTMTLTGSGFSVNSQVIFDGFPIVTTYTSVTQLTAVIPTGQLTFARVAQVYVSTPGAGSSNSLAFTVGNGGAGAPISIFCNPGVGPSSPNSSYAANCVVNGGTGPYTWSVSSGALPTGLTLSPNGTQALIAGLTTLTGPYSYTLQVTDSSTPTKSTTLTFAGETAPTTSPSLSTLSPASIPINSAPFTLTLFGSGFTPGALVTFGSFTLTSTFISSSQITASIPAAYLTTSQTVNVSVGNSNSLPFVITAGSLNVTCSTTAGPTTVGTFYSQLCSVSGGNGVYTWTVVGLPAGLAYMAGGSTVSISGTPTTAQSYSYSIQANDTSGHVGSLNISGTVTQSGYNITSLSPSSAPVGSGQITMIVFGKGFTQSSAVYFNGNFLITQYVSATQLNASVTANFLTTAGTYSVFVNTPASGTTNSLPFTVGTPLTLSSLSPTSVPVGSPTFTLTVNGSGFSQGILVTFGATSFSTTFINSNQLSVTIPAAFLTTAQTVNVSVGNSNSLPFVIGTPSLNVTCNPPMATLTLGTYYSLTCTVSGGTAPYIWTATPIPAGLFLTPAGSTSFTIAGTPTTAGIQTFTVNVADSNATPHTASTSITLTVQVSMPATKVGVFRANVAFLEDTNGNGIYDPGIDRYFSTFAGPGGFLAGDIPVIGDWTGDSKAKVGIYRTSTGQWFLDANNNGILDAGDFTYSFGGVPGDVPVTGDWLSTNKTCIGIFREGFFWVLDLNCNGQFDSATDATFPFGGVSGDVPVVGAWTGNGTRVGVVRKYAPAGVPIGDPFYWVLDGGAANAGNLPANHQPGSTFAFGGLPGDVFITGDWTNTGTSAAGVFRTGYWVLDAALPGAPQSSHLPGLTFGYGGVPGDVPITGKW